MLRPKLNRVWTSASATLRRDPGDAKYLQGWISEIPTFQVLNYLQYKVDTTLLALAERGVFEWGNDVQYGMGSLAWDETDRKIYISIVGNPSKTLAPSANLSQWSPSSLQVSRGSFDTINAAITAHIADITSNPHKVTAAQIGAYNKAEIDALVNQYKALVSAHASRKDNPHAVTAAQVGAVPITGGTYTGDVTFNGGMYFDAGKVNQISKSGGIYLQSGTALLGIDDTGAAVAGTTSSKSKLVTESSFPSVKAAQEPSYAVPQPELWMPLMGDINIYTGSGTVNSSWDTSFGPSGQLIISPKMDNSSNPLISMDSVNPFLGAANLCVCVDIQQISAPVSDSAVIYTVGFGRPNGCRVGIRADGFVAALNNASTISSTTSTLADGKVHRVVARKSATALSLFVDGVLVSSSTANNQPVDAFLSFVVQNTGLSGNSYNGAYISNLRVWNELLSDKQISTL